MRGLAQWAAGGQVTSWGFLAAMRVGDWLDLEQNRRLLLLLALAGALALALQHGDRAYLGGFGSVGSQDFMTYWTAGRLAIRAENPYDAESVFGVQLAAGWPYDDPNLLWNPPWVLAIIVPVGLLPFHVATFVWLLLQLTLLLVNGFVLWRYVAPRSGRYWIGLVLAACFVPSWFALTMGQISPWLLAGAVGFLWAARKGRDLAAGAALALLMIKPHVTYLFFLAALWWIWRSRRWRIPIGLLVALAGASGLVLLVDRDIFGEYLAAAANPPLYWATPTLGAWLRILFGVDQYWLQFVPSLVGALGLVVWLWRRRGPWRWDLVAGPLLLASVVTAAYGWSYDHLVLLPAVAVLVNRVRQSSRGRQAVVLVLLVAFELALLIQQRQHPGDQFSVWHPWALTALYCWTDRSSSSEGTDA